MSIQEKLVPLSDTVWILRDKPEVVSRGGIALTTSEEDDRPCSGTVMGIGPECVWVMPGQRVAFRKYAGVSYFPDPLDHSVEWVLLDEEDDIHAVIG